MTPRRGERYESRVWLDEHRKPLVHVITRVARGVVYYRPDYGPDGLGSPAKFPIEQAEKWLGKKVEEGA